MKLKGSRTEKSILMAFVGESYAYNSYSYSSYSGQKAGGWASTRMELASYRF